MLNSENVHNISFAGLKYGKVPYKSSSRKVCFTFWVSVWYVYWWLSQCDILLTLQEGNCFYRSLLPFVKERQTSSNLNSHSDSVLSGSQCNTNKNRKIIIQSVLWLWTWMSLLLTSHVLYQHLNCKTFCFATYITIPFLFFQTWILFPGTK